MIIVDRIHAESIQYIPPTLSFDTIDLFGEENACVSRITSRALKPRAIQVSAMAPALNRNSGDGNVRETVELSVTKRHRTLNSPTMEHCFRAIHEHRNSIWLRFSPGGAPIFPAVLRLRPDARRFRQLPGVSSFPVRTNHGLVDGAAPSGAPQLISRVLRVWHELSSRSRSVGHCRPHLGGQPVASWPRLSGL